MRLSMRSNQEMWLRKTFYHAVFVYLEVLAKVAPISVQRAHNSTVFFLLLAMTYLMVRMFLLNRCSVCAKERKRKNRKLSRKWWIWMSEWRKSFSITISESEIYNRSEKKGGIEEKLEKRRKKRKEDECISCLPNQVLYLCCRLVDHQLE